MSEEEKLPEEKSPVETEDTPDAPAEDAPDEPADVPEEPDAPPEDNPGTRAIASAEDQPHDPTQETRACTVPEESTQSRDGCSVTLPREKGRRPHPLWRGFWLAVCILGIAVLMGRIDAPGAAWARQPMRAFGGAIAAGGVLASLPGLIRHDLPERPRLRRCLLGLFIGLIWGVLG